MRSLCICVLILGIAILPIKGGEGCRMIVSDGNMSCYAEKIANLKLIHDFVTQNTKFAKGVSAPFAGCIGEDLVIAGGCNFPDVPAEKGGTKVYYKDVYAARIEKDTLLSWSIVGELPQPMAYGFSVSTSDGIVCVGGMNENGAMEKAFRLSMVNGKLKMEDLPSLPFVIISLSPSIE